MNPLFEKILQTANAGILAAADHPNKDRWSVNWHDLRCVDVMQCKDYYGDTKWVVVITEASPDAHEFQTVIQTYLKDELSSMKGIDIEVITEW